MEEKLEKIIELLEGIESKLDNIDLYTMDIGSLKKTIEDIRDNQNK